MCVAVIRRGKMGTLWASLTNFVCKDGNQSLLVTY